MQPSKQVEQSVARLSHSISTPARSCQSHVSSPCMHLSQVLLPSASYKNTCFLPASMCGGDGGYFCVVIDAPGNVDNFQGLPIHAGGSELEYAAFETAPQWWQRVLRGGETCACI